MPLTDEDAAILAIAELDPLSDEQKAAQAQVARILDPGSDLPFVDVHELFRLYDILYFRKLFKDSVEVSWSPRLTLCAGICELLPEDKSKNRGRSIRLKLSEPLLQFRPPSDVVNTLLHEAIHAYFFLTTSWQHSRGDDGTGHGAGFLLLADAINSHGGYEVTVFHTFHDEVDHFRRHVWQCDGPCKERPPYFGLVKRAMNRPPGKSDHWWARHQQECGGTYTKIAEPEKTKKQRDKMSAKERAGMQKNKLDTWVCGSQDQSGATCKEIEVKVKDVIDLTGDQDESDGGLSKKRPMDNEAGSTAGPQRTKKVLAACPICDAAVDEAEINGHLDTVHPD
ncbi:SprT-like family-domain-containing protein [Lineolata rhizophorae]|uniref:Protein with SprT-like domain at the N terminus n=1 Tax=Lineolata rhizophorae TaxID=578093 RepID=A0A6A6PB14_9PEZI|nr:SprT-like family-domain-containing protein [Lineolata rhizophorae]